MSILKNLTEKKKQQLRLLLIVGGLVILVALLSTVMGGKDKDKKAQDSKARDKGKFSILTEKVEKESWIAAQGNNIKKLQVENEEFKREIESLKGNLENMKAKQRDIENTARSAVFSNLPAKPEDKTVKPNSLLPPLPKIDKNRTGATEGSPEHEGKRPRKDSAASKRDTSIKVFTDSATIEGEAPDTKKKKPENGPSITLSSGSFMKAVMLNGIDAPTDFGSKTEPYPVLMNVSDTAILPNLHRMNLKNCFIIGAGYGNLADERAYIRTEKISCITESGRVIDTVLKGHAIGEDGKLGIRGKLVSKQGQLIAQSLLSGTLSGLAKAFKPQQNVAINLNPNSGNTGLATPAVEDVLRSGGTEGVSSAMNKVSEFYIKMAEKIFPIIEIDAGRKVDILVLEQTDLIPGDAGSGGLKHEK